MVGADVLITRFQLQDQFSGPARKVQASAQGIAASLSAPSAAAQGLAKTAGAAMNAVGVAATSAANPVLGLALAAATAGVALKEALSSAAEAAAQSMNAAADFESLVMSLQAVEGSAQGAQSALKELQQLARAPGLGFEEAVGAFNKLRNAGVERNFSLALVREIANSNARAGGNRESFSRAMLAASQIANNDFLQGDELNQFSEANIPARRYIKQRFGTANTEELKKLGVTSRAVLAALTLEMSKEERVAGGTRNAFDNLGGSIKATTVAIGTSINTAFRPLAEQLGATIDVANQGGVFKSIADDLARIFELDGSNLENVFINIVAGVKTAVDSVTILLDALSALFPLLSAALPWASNGGAAVGGAIGELFQRNREQTALEFDLGRKRQSAGGSNAMDSIASWVEGIAEERSHAQERTARNTEELVSIQRDQLQLDRRILGGGTFGAKALAPVEVGRALGASSSRNRHVNDLVKVLENWAASMAEEMTGINQRATGYAPVRH